jgi:hypothetical protein
MATPPTNIPAPHRTSPRPRPPRRGTLAALASLFRRRGRAGSSSFLAGKRPPAIFAVALVLSVAFCLFPSLAAAAEQPTVESTSSSAVTTDCATFEAQINPGGAATTYHFEYIPKVYFEESGYRYEHLRSTPESASIGSDDAGHPVSATVCGLEPGRAYEFRAVATNEVATVPGPSQTFTTPVEPPVIESTYSSNRTVGCTTIYAALFNGGAQHNDEFNRRGENATYHFEYLTAQQYESDGQTFGAGTETTAEAEMVNEREPVHAEVCHLAEPRVTYYFRVDATNTKSPPGGTLGPTETFTTLNAPSHELAFTFGDAAPTTATNVEDPYPLSGPTDLAEDQATHDLYVTDPANHRVEEFDRSGEFLLMFGKEVNKTAVENHSSTEAEQNLCTAASHDICQPASAAPPTGATPPEVTDVAAGQFLTPTYIAVDNSTGPSAGDLYVADTGTHLVSKFDSAGHLIAAWGDGEGKGQEDGRDSGQPGTGGYLKPFFGSIHDLAVGATTGDLYVYAGSNIWWYTPAGIYVQYGNIVRPWFSAEEPEPLFDQSSYALDPSSAELYHDAGSAVYHYSPACKLPTVPAFSGSAEQNGEIHFSCEGEPLDAFGAGQLSAAQGLAVDGATHAVYVADSKLGEGDVAAFEDIRPAATTDPPAAAGETTLTLAGHVDPDTDGLDHGPIEECFFEWGLTPTYGHRAPCEPPTPYTGAEAVTAKLSGLTPTAQLPIGTEYHYRLVAANQKGATAEGEDETASTAAAPQIEGVSASHLSATSAELDASFNPRGLQTTYRFSYGTTTAYGQATPTATVAGTTAQLSRSHKVAVPLAGLTSGATYHFRLTVENELGERTSEDHAFEFFPPTCPNAAVRQQTGSAYLPDCRAYELVSPGNANATLLYPGGPNTGQATSPSRFSFSGLWSALPGASTIETGGDLYVATRTDTGWESRYIGLPGSEAGCMGGPPTDARSAPDYGYAPNHTNAVLTDPSMDRFLSFIDGGAAECFGFPFSEGSWEFTSPSNAPYLFGSEGTDLGRLPTDLGQLPGAAEALQCPYPAEENELGSCSGETTASPDLTHLIFSSNRMDFAAGSQAGQGLTVAPGSAYDDDLATGRVELISKLPNGDPIAQDPAFAGVPPGGDSKEPVPGGREEYLRFPAVSTDGSHVLISTATAPTPICAQGNIPHACQRFTDTPLHLYMRVDDSLTYEIAEDPHTGEPAPVDYVGMTPDGSRVYFTSEQHLTGEDEAHAGASLYMWSENGGHPTLTLISKPDPASPPGAGDTAECHPALAKYYTNGQLVGEAPWTAGCAVQPWSGYSTSWWRGEAGGNGISDTAIAANGDIYFYSPEQLAGPRGVPGQQNLYDYRAAEGKLQYVTTLTPERLCSAAEYSRNFCSDGPLVRLDVSPDDSHVAFLTASRLTSYDNAHREEMYSYTPSTESLICDSCNPDGKPPTANVEASQDGLFMTDDGRTFFSTEESLLPADTNAGIDVYEFLDGHPQLITPGTGTGGVTSHYSPEARPGLVAVSANGTDVYFSTFDVLTAEDHNGNFLKFYDARTDGGFPQPPPNQPCAAAEECHGPGTEPPGLPTQGTAATLAGGNATPEHHPKHHKKKAKKKHKKATAKHHHRAAKHGRGGKK